MLILFKFKNYKLKEEISWKISNLKKKLVQ